MFLAQALTSGQSLEPLTRLWLECADIDQLLDPDARPFSRFTKFWAQPLVWLLLRRPGGALDRSVSPDARSEVRTKLSRLVRARWFAPPFSGTGFSRLLYDAIEAMAASPPGPKLIPIGQPLDLFVTVTDFKGHLERLRLNSPAEVVETEHRLSIGFRYLRGRDDALGRSCRTGVCRARHRQLSRSLPAVQCRRDGPDAGAARPALAGPRRLSCNAFFRSSLTRAMPKA